MYGARAYLAYLRYGAMRFFQDKILRGHGNFWSRKKNYRSRIPINIARSLRTFGGFSSLLGSHLSRYYSRFSSYVDDVCMMTYRVVNASEMKIEWNCFKSNLQTSNFEFSTNLLYFCNIYCISIKHVYLVFPVFHFLSEIFIQKN